MVNFSTTHYIISHEYEVCSVVILVPWPFKVLGPLFFFAHFLMPGPKFWVLGLTCYLTWELTPFLSNFQSSELNLLPCPSFQSSKFNMSLNRVLGFEFKVPLIMEGFTSTLSSGSKFNILLFLPKFPISGFTFSLTGCVHFYLPSFQGPSSRFIK